MEASDFVARYPEFRTVGSGQLDLVLAAAALSVDSSIYGAKTDEAVAALAGDLIWNSPYGVTMRTASSDADRIMSPYARTLARLRNEQAPKMFVI